MKRSDSPRSTAGIGRHLLADLFGIEADLLCDGAALERLLQCAATTAGAHVLGGHFHSFGPAHGVTGVVTLAESHISIHTWPESGIAAVDVFMCGDALPELALEVLASALRPAQRHVKIIARGLSAAHRSRD